MIRTVQPQSQYSLSYPRTGMVFGSAVLQHARQPVPVAHGHPRRNGALLARPIARGVRETS